MGEKATACVKHLLFGFNVVFWLAGAVVFIIGLWLRYDNKTKPFLEQEDYHCSFYVGIIIFIVAGTLMIVVGFLGCCGAIRESRPMLGLFFVFLLAIFTTEIAAGIWAYENRDEIITELQQFYKSTYLNFVATKEESVKETLQAMHFALPCCGLTGRLEGSLSGTCAAYDDDLPLKSCPEVIDDIFKSKFQVIGAISIAIGFIILFGMIFSRFLCCAIGKDKAAV